MVPVLPRLQEYPERVQPEMTETDRMMRRVLAYLVPAMADLAPLGARHPVVLATMEAATSLASLSDDALRLRRAEVAPALRRALRKKRLHPSDAAPALALISEWSARLLGQRPYAVQILAAWALLGQTVAEMRTGEGKSLTAAVAAGFLALGGVPVHLVTVNDYLAERDHKFFAPLFAALGLTAGLVIDGAAPEARRAAYATDVVHTTAKELVFDYLRDRTKRKGRRGNLAQKADRILGQSQEDTAPVMRGLTAALVDEADSVLIDQAGTPYILSGATRLSGSLAPEALAQAMALAKGLTRDRDYRLLSGQRTVELTDSGLDRLQAQTQAQEDGPLRIAAIRDHAVKQALTALHVLEVDRDYLVDAGKIVIIDESTGRVMPDRNWSEGLHQMVELKEGVSLSPMNQTLARITLQTFFRRYLRLSGTTGTARDARRELWEVYGLSVRRIPPRKPDQRLFAPPHLFPTQAEKLAALATEVARLLAEGAAVLIGARTVAGSEAISQALAAFPHRVLNANTPAEEAAIVGGAGQVGSITVATNMAGRGTDIGLSKGAIAAGGLHVVLTELHDSRRVDLQLAGRCGRQGDPGRVLTLLSLEDDLLARRGPFLRTTAAAVLRHLGDGAAARLMRWLQRREEAAQAATRLRLLEAERRRDLSLSLSGEPE